MLYILLNIKTKDLEIIDKKEVLDKLYFLEHKMITNENIINYKKNDNIKKIISEENYLKNIKLEISKIEDKVPLYDIYSANLFLISKYNVYERVVNNYYRFPEEELLKDLKERKEYLESHEELKDILKMRELNKIKLILEFIECFDLDILYDTYIKVFYKYSTFVGKELTTCKRLSFLPQLKHLRPYYTRSEIINIALNMGMEIDEHIEYSDMRKICKKITKNEMSFDMLLKHKKYMIKNKSLGIMQFYTLQGSSMINFYLRNKTQYKNKNVYLENLIQQIWNLVLDAPEFDKNYTLYRFINSDDYLLNLKLGDTFTENGFMSTTRDPFYKAETYNFGFILIKINIPKNIKGVALCVETISHFPEEQEIVFPPRSKFKLIKKDSDCVYYHTDIKFSSKVKTRYEFDWIENEQPIFTRKEITPQIFKVDFLNIERKFELPLFEKIKYFENYYVNNMNQFLVKIGDKDITVISEWYDSTEAYKDFYAIKSKNSYSLYSIYDNYILFFIEISEVDFEYQMHINYYVKYSAIDANKIFGDNNLILLYSSIAYYFDIHNVVIYASYMNCDNNSLEENQGLLFGGSYCVDFYNYFVTNKKRYFDLNNIELYPLFSYYDFDFLKTVNLDKILFKTDGEIYQIYQKIYSTSTNNNNIIDFYIWLLKNSKCYLLDEFVNYIDRVLQENPFKKDYYILDPITFLYNRKYIKLYSSRFKMLKNIKREIIKKNINQR